MNYRQLTLKFEEAIRRGEIHSVQREIEELKPNLIPRPDVADFADIARRVRSETWGLRLLRPLVRAEPPLIPPPSEKELCAYAGLLVKIGSWPEAEKILQSISSDESAQALTFRSQIHITQWNYRQAALDLKKVISRKDISDYQRCIAQVNLVSAYVFLEKYNEAQKILPLILQSCERNKWDLLFGNALELSAQLAVMQHDWPLARKLLQDAQNRSGQHTHYSIFIEKWRLIAELFQAPQAGPLIEDILKKTEILRDKASHLNSWETVRDLDYHVALHLNHQNLLLNVYFGTPHAEYKKRIEAIFKDRGWKIPDFYFRKLSSEPATRILDLNTGAEEGVLLKNPLKPGKMLHRFLNILAMDFYRPIGVGELFSKLFPDEYFNPDTSIDRVSQAVKLLRKWFETNDIPLDIRVENQRYFLQATGPYAFKMFRQSKSFEELLQSGSQLQLQKLKDKWPYQSFSASAAAQELGVSVSHARSLLQKALDNKFLYKSGLGRSTVYRFEK